MIQTCMFLVFLLLHFIYVRCIGHIQPSKFMGTFLLIHVLCAQLFFVANAVVSFKMQRISSISMSEPQHILLLSFIYT